MSHSEQKQELTPAAIVVVGYTDDGDKDYQEQCVVPASLLWEAEGLAELFETLRAGLFGDRNERNDEAWDSFHIVSMQEKAGYLILSDGHDWPDAEPPRDS